MLGLWGIREGCSSLHYVVCLRLQQHLKKVTEQFPDDVEAWIELAQILERNDVQVLFLFVLISFVLTMIIIISVC